MAGFRLYVLVSFCTRSIMWGGMGIEVKLHRLIRRHVWRFRNKYMPCMFPVGPRRMDGLDHVGMNLVGRVSLLVSE